MSGSTLILKHNNCPVFGAASLLMEKTPSLCYQVLIGPACTFHQPLAASIPETLWSKYGATLIVFVRKSHGDIC